MRNAMVRLFVGGALALGVFATPHRFMAQDQAVLVVEGGTLIDGTGGPPVPDSLVVIRGARIERVGRRGDLAVPAGARIVNAQGKYVIPGLMDAHVHYEDFMAELMLVHGVTSVMEIGGGGEVGLVVREAVKRGRIAGPRLFLAVGSMSGGRIAELGARSSLQGPLGGRQVVADGESARKLARRFIEAGADMIKVHRGPPADAYRAAADEAHKAGLPLVAQPLGPTVYAREAVLAGADIIEHAAGVGYSIAKDPSRWKGWGDIEPHSLDPTIFADMDEAKAAEFIQLLVSRRVYLEPDFVCQGRGLFTKRDEYELNDYRLLRNPALHYLPERRPIKWLRNYVEFDDMEPAARERRRQGLRNMMRFISQFAAAGGKVLAGTDTPGWAVPGVSMHYELDLLVEAGLTPMQAIVAATRNVAEAFRVAKDLGTVESGKLADLVILRADPLRAIGNSRTIELVIKDGRPIEPTLDRSFTPLFTGREGVEGLTWYSALKKQTMNYDAQWAFGWPPPGIESISPTLVTAGDETFTLVVKGVNFVRPSLVYVNGQVVPTQVVSDEELHATIDGAMVTQAGTYAVVVSNPEPRQRPEWGTGPSNKAFLTVKFRYD